MSDAEQTIKSLRKVNQMLEDRLKKQKAAGNSDAEVERLTGEVKSLNERLKSAESEKAALKVSAEERSSLVSSNEDLASSNSKLKSVNQMLQSRLEEVSLQHKQLAKRDAFYVEIEEQNKKLSEQLEGAKSGGKEVEQLRKELWAKEKALLTATDNIDELKKENQQLKSKKSSNQKPGPEVAKLESKLKDAEKENHDLKAELQMMRSGMEAKDRALQESKKDDEKRIEQLRSLNKTFEERLKAANAKNKELEAKAASSTPAKSPRKTGLFGFGSSSNAEADELRQKLTEVEKEKSDLVQKMAQVDAKNKELEVGKIQVLEVNLSAARLDVEAAKEENVKLNGKISKLEEELKRNEAAAAASSGDSKKVTQLQEVNKILEKRLKEEVVKSKALAAKVADMEKDMKKLEEDLAKEKAQRSESVSKERAAAPVAAAAVASGGVSSDVYQKKIENLQKVNKLLEDKLKESKSDLAAKSMALTKQTAIVDQMKQVNKMQNERYVAIKKEADEGASARAKVASLEKELGAKAGMEQENKALKSQVGKNAMVIEQLRKEVVASSSDAEKEKEKVESLRKLNKAQMDRMREQQEKSDAELNPLKSKCAEQEKTIEKLQAESKKKDESLAKEQATVVSLRDVNKKQMERLRDSGADSSKKVASLEKEVESLKKELGDASKEKERAVVLEKELGAKKTSDSQELARLQKDLSEKSAALEKESKTTASLRDLNKLQTEKLRKEADAWKAEKAKLADEVEKEKKAGKKEHEEAKESAKKAEKLEGELASAKSELKEKESALEKEREATSKLRTLNQLQMEKVKEEKVRAEKLEKSQRSVEETKAGSQKLEGEVAALTTELKEKNVALEKEASTVKSLRNLNNMQMEKSKKDRAELEVREKKLKEAKEKEEKLEKEIAKLQSDLKQKEAEKESASRMLSEKSKSDSSAVEASKKLQEEVESLRAELKAKTEALEKEQETSKKLRQLNSLQMEKSKKDKTEAEKLTKEIASLKAAAAAVEGEDKKKVVALQVALDESSTVAASLKSENARLEEELKEKSGALDKEVATVASLRQLNKLQMEKSKKASSEQLERSTKDVSEKDELQAKNVALEKEVAALKEASRKAAGEKEAAVSKEKAMLKSSLDKAYADGNKKDEEMKKQSETINNLRQVNQMQIDKMKKTQAEVKSLKDENEKLQKENKEMSSVVVLHKDSSSKAEAMETENARLKDELAQVKNVAEEKERVVKHQENELKLKQEAESLTEIRVEAAQLRAQSKELEHELEKVKSENALLSSKVLADAKTVSSLQEEAVSLKAESRELGRQVRHLESDLDETKAKLHTAETIAEDSKARARSERSRTAAVMEKEADEENAILQAKLKVAQARQLHAKQVASRQEMWGNGDESLLSLGDINNLLLEQARTLEASLSGVASVVGDDSVVSIASADNGKELAARKLSSAASTAQPDAETLEKLHVAQKRINELESEAGSLKDQNHAAAVATKEAQRLYGVEKSRVDFLEERLRETEEELKENRGSRVIVNRSGEDKDLKEQNENLVKERDQARNDVITALDAVGQWEQRYVAASESAKRLREREELGLVKIAELESQLNAQGGGSENVGERSAVGDAAFGPEEESLCCLVSLDGANPHVGMNRGGAVSFGRDKSCAVFLDGRDISHRHARVVYDVDLHDEGITYDGRTPFVLEDTSSNGVFVNFEKVGKGNSRRLNNGDLIWFSKESRKTPKSNKHAYVFQVSESLSKKSITVPPPKMLRGANK